jgi:dihydrodipicolinate synthase/N-acetylneuraminate lyase
MASSSADEEHAAVLAALRAGAVIPAHPLALDSSRKLDERRQRALSRYYLDSGVGGIAVGVHTTQFAIHNPKIGLLRPVLELAAEEINRRYPGRDERNDEPLIRVAGICGDTTQAVREAELARRIGYHLGLLNLSALRGSTITELLSHCRSVAGVIDLFGFYLQPAVGGMELPYEFWHGFCEIENVRAIKIAAFDRYRTITVIRAVAESRRDDIALYTGNDDNILADLLTPYKFVVGGRSCIRTIVGGLLGQWAVWTSKAVSLHRQCRALANSGDSIPADLLRIANQLTDANAAIFDAANNFRGCIPGIHEILRRQGLLDGIWCLDENETLSSGQAAEIDRVIRAYPHLTDDDFVQQNLHHWLA